MVDGRWSIVDVSHPPPDDRRSAGLAPVSLTDFAAVRPNYAGGLRRPTRIPSAMRPIVFVLAFAAMTTSLQAQRARARDLGVAPGVFSPGANNAITDVAGVRVGHTTVTEGAGIRTGVTAILPPAGN